MLAAEEGCRGSGFPTFICHPGQRSRRNADHICIEIMQSPLAQLQELLRSSNKQTACIVHCCGPVLAGVFLAAAAPLTAAAAAGADTAAFAGVLPLVFGAAL
jgi:hypothetical protein